MSDPPARVGGRKKGVTMNKGYRVVRLDSRSIYGGHAMTRWLTYGEAMTYVRYANRTRVGRFVVVSKRGVIQKVEA